MTQTRDLIHKMAEFFKSEEFFEKGEDAKLELSPDDVRCMNEIIKACWNGISRQTVFKIIDNLKANFTCYDFVTLDEVASHIKAIPSAEPYKGMTNGEVVKAVFGFKPRKNTCIIPKLFCNGNPAECDGCKYNDWWNSPYEPQERSEDDNNKNV